MISLVKVKDEATSDDEEELNRLRDSEQCPKDVYILDICATLFNTIILSTHGYIFSWGAQSDTLGRKSNSQHDALRPTRLQINQKILMISAGQMHVLALDHQGFMLSWGSNQFGQLGIGSLESSQTPKEIDILKKNGVRIQFIQAGGDSSYAIGKDDRIYAWGDNRSFQLGLGDRDEPIIIPTVVERHPWVRQKECIREQREYGSKDLVKMYLCKNNNAFFYKLQNFWDIYYNQKLNYITQDMRNEILRLQTKLIEIQQVSLKQQPYIEKNIKNDYILSETDNQLNYIQRQLEQRESDLKDTEDEISNLEKDLTSVKQQLFDIFAKETELHNQREEIDMIIRKLQRRQQKSKELEQKQKEQNRIKELFQANDNIKNTLLRRQNASEEAKLHKQAHQIKQAEQLKDMKGLQSLLVEVDKERKIYLKAKLMEGNKADLEKFMDKITFFFKEMEETQINTMARKSEKQIPLDQIISSSNAKLTYIKNELMGFKVNSNDESYEILTKILEIFHDAINIRKKLNDYLQGLIMPDDQEKPKKSTVLSVSEKYQQLIQKQEQDALQANVKYY
ncbi:hypothetical protein pb186bvf_000021 [Paramecium bursaria]